MTVELASLGNKTSRVTVAKYMHQLSLRGKLSKKFKVTMLYPFFRQKSK